MAEKSRPADEARSRAEALKAITAFEQILEIVPNDLSTLDALVRSCEMVGDAERARKYLIRLIRAHLDLGNTAQVEALADELRRLADGDPDAFDLLAELEGTSRRPATPPPPSPESQRPVESAERPETNLLDAELSLAWRLHEAQLLTQTDYTAVANELTVLAAQPVAERVSALYILYTRRFPKLDSALAFLSRQSRTPIINVAAFNPPRSCRDLLPTEFQVRRCVLPFEQIGPETLVALLNPLDESLRADVGRRIGARCHFYLTRPDQFDKAMEASAGRP